MKIVLVFLIGFAALVLPAASRPADKPFECANELKYDFMPAEAMEFINGTVKNPGRSAAPDADAEYSNKVKVDNLIFTLPGELCETMSACYKADFNGDGVSDYVFVNIKVWNGRFAGQSDVGIFVSNPQKKYTFNAFETRYLEAEIINGKVMLVKYDFSDDDETYIRQIYTFNSDGRLKLFQAEAFTFQY